MINFFRANLWSHFSVKKNKIFPFALFYFKEKMKNKIQKKFGILLSEFKNFSLFILSKGIIEETLDFLFESNPFCLWWTIQLFFSARIFKNLQSQKYRLGVIKFFLVLNQELFGSKKKKKQFVGKSMESEFISKFLFIFVLVIF